MTLHSLLLFASTCFVITLMPGPNSFLTLNNAVQLGFNKACLAGAGRLIAFIGMISLTALGLAAVLKTSETLFTLIKVAGAGYLFYLAIVLWRSKAELTVSSKNTAQHSLKKLIQQDFWVAVGNPKAILLFTALFPQFMNTEQPASYQFAILGSLFLCFECFAIIVYASLGKQLAHFLTKSKIRRWFNRSCAALFASAGASLLGSSQA
ncbi:LysE family translocator [Pseudomonas sp. F1_0610]|uniref:LysE family translocator n=1 Tax=Pseudomonas sp. F1_0610 TaxID=3114284 RepID=UPI0039C11D7C